MSAREYARKKAFEEAQRRIERETREGERFAQELTAGQVSNWRWITSPDHVGRVPDMPYEERCAMRYLWSLEFRPSELEGLFRALERKVRYRAKKSKGGIWT